MVMEMNLWAEKERRKGGWFGSSTADRDGSKQFKFLSTARQGQILWISTLNLLTSTMPQLPRLLSIVVPSLWRVLKLTSPPFWTLQI